MEDKKATEINKLAYMNKYKNIADLLKSVERLERTHLYDVNKFTRSIAHLASQLEYFYCHLADEQGREPNQTFYYVKTRPHVHQLAYFNIGRGYPKEVMDGHYCYVLSDLGTKMVIIPCTSIKEDSQNPDPRFQKDIIVRSGNELMVCRLQLSDIRAVDIQRIDVRKDIRECVTSKAEIHKCVGSVLSTDISKQHVWKVRYKDGSDKKKPKR
ncbi:MAG: hypothetical protein J6P61_06390 [Erysipelotrichaceae bacterium]|nr:hypothetical protein [Erysipelotrichaceae bacterium]